MTISMNPMGAGRSDEAVPDVSKSLPFSYTNSRGQIYYLHGKSVTLQNGRPMTVYAFARTVKAREALESLPAGHRILERSDSALPYLKRLS